MEITLKIEALYWFSALSLFYIYAGYPLLLLLSAVIFRKPLSTVEITQDLSLIITAHNEEAVIRKKLENCLALDYPKDKLEIIVVSDHSDDRTDEIISDFADSGITLLRTGSRIGKTGAQNKAVLQTGGKILVFSDANSLWESNALKRLIAPFTDPLVGYVCGRLKYINTGEGASSFSEGLYWRYEIFLRKLESATGAITAGNGAIYAVRAEDYFNFNDNQSHDFEFPRYLNSRLKKAVYVHEAIAYEKAGATTGDEFKRKVRMLARVWGSILKTPGVLSPFQNKFSFTWKFISHRLFRYLAPLPLALIFALNIFLYLAGSGYQILLIAQIAFYSLALTGAVHQLKSRVFYIPLYFCLFHFASVAGLVKALFNSAPAYWEKAGSTRT